MSGERASSDAGNPASLEISVNGARYVTRATPDTPLLYVLRNELGLYGPKFGCGLGQCGACTVHVGGDAVRSCVTPVAAAIANAIFDATGARLRELPFTADRVRHALA